MVQPAFLFLSNYVETYPKTDVAINQSHVILRNTYPVTHPPSVTYFMDGEQANMSGCAGACVDACVGGCARTCDRGCMDTYARACDRACEHAFQSAYVRGYVSACVRASMRTCA